MKNPKNYIGKGKVGDYGTIRVNVKMSDAESFIHTAENGETGPFICFKGIDGCIYYLLSPDGAYHNFSGTGNTFNCNHPTVAKLILDSLRYWADEMHVDGFRFDLASILTR